ncbi:Inosose dehydratase [Thalassocella blandensis]|nr:Inosose dehydratase [Thalassocella blandensis]
MNKLLKSAAIAMFATTILSACGHSKMQTTVKSEHRVTPKIGVQLWSVKEDVKKDFNATLQRLANLGFDGVEFAGEFGPFEENPTALKDFLQSLHLEVSAAHIGFEALSEESFDKTVNFYRALGVSTLIIAWDERAWDDKGVVEMVQELNQLSEKLAPYEINIGFHNHDQEFKAYAEGTYWDYIAQNTHENVVLQLDVGWVRYAGLDPVTFVERYPGRTLTSHFKIRTRPEQDLSPVIGQNPRGKLNWEALIQAEIQSGGTQWFIVEQEEYPEAVSPMDAVAASKEGLMDILKQLQLTP